MTHEEMGLVFRCQQGDQEALKEIFDLYHKKVYRVAYGVVRQKEDALDIVQEVFLKLFRSLRHFKGKSHLYTYLYRMTVNTAIDYARKKKKFPLSTSDEEGEFQIPGKVEERPDQILLHKELEERTREALEKLPANQRMAILLKEIEGLSYQEMAGVMDCSIGTVMSRLYYGRKKLQELLKDYVKLEA